jgi:hypothetical protein
LNMQAATPGGAQYAPPPPDAGYGAAGDGILLNGLIPMELARGDAVDRDHLRAYMPESRAR